NTLVLRNRPHDDMTFRQFLAEVKTQAAAAFDNQDYPFEDLVEKIMPNRDVARNPIFDTMFVHRVRNTQPDNQENTRPKPEKTPPLKITPYGYNMGLVLFDLTLAVDERDEQLYIRFVYATKLFQEETILRFIDYYKEIVSAVIADKNIQLKEIEISHDLQTTETDIYDNIESDLDF
ncbi:MAG: hypothetical protein GY757_38260, partial [bacterium]|nr:hypothetical protein [bacterium]